MDLLFAGTLALWVWCAVPGWIDVFAHSSSEKLSAASGDGGVDIASDVKKKEVWEVEAQWWHGVLWFFFPWLYPSN